MSVCYSTSNPNRNIMTNCMFYLDTLIENTKKSEVVNVSTNIIGKIEYPICPIEKRRDKWKMLWNEIHFISFSTVLYTI